MNALFVEYGAYLGWIYMHRVRLCCNIMLSMDKWNCDRR